MVKKSGKKEKEVKPIRLKLIKFSPTREKIRAIKQIEKDVGSKEIVKGDLEKAKKERSKLRFEQVMEVKKFGEETAARIEKKVGKVLKSKAISKSILKKPKISIVVREQVSAPYIPLYLMRPLS